MMEGTGVIRVPLVPETGVRLQGCRDMPELRGAATSEWTLTMSPQMKRLILPPLELLGRCWLSSPRSDTEG